MSEKPHRVLVVDDHPMFREGLIDLLRTVPEIDVIADAATSEEAVDAAVEHRPSVVIMDLQVPVKNGGTPTHDGGLDAIRSIIKKVPGVRILVLTAFEEIDLVKRALCAGARGYCPKQSNGAEILNALGIVAQGGLVTGPSIADGIQQLLSLPSGNAPPEPFSRLTDREFEIVKLVAQGKSNPEIAKALHIAPATVANNLTNIYSQLDVNRSELIAMANAKGIGG